MFKRYFIILSLLVLLTGCASARRHRDLVRDDAERITVGKVQREIRVGMSSSEVAEIMGSPNVVSTDAQRREVWIYDKISTEVAYSKSTSGISILIIGGVGASGARSTSQRTLTVIIKFDHRGKVRDFAYHTSRF